MNDLTISDAMETAARHHLAGDFPQAERIYRQVLSLKPNDPDVLCRLGVLAVQARHPDAVPLLRAAIAHRPDFSEAQAHLGDALQAQGDLREAIEYYQKALANRPDEPEIWNNLANACIVTGQPLEAVRCCRRSVALRPEDPRTHNILGDALRGCGKLDEAIAAFQTALTIDRNFAEAHGNLAHALLQRGELEEGYREYEWRWQCSTYLAPRRQFARPQWDGSDPAGRTILLHAEQGLGDTIQHVRFVPQIVRRGGRVIIACARELVRLLQESKELGATQVVSNFADVQGSFDTHLPMMSLPFAMKVCSEADIPRQVPYLSGNPRTLTDDRMKVGLVWSGSFAHTNDRNRSMTLQTLAPLADDKISFYSLQLGPAAAEAGSPPAGMNLTDCAPGIQDVADTAEIIAALDLVICVDTAVAHLAGALGKKVWVMLPQISDFRWMLDREDSPWYPTMRLFRQTRAGDWADVIQRIRQQLRSLA